MNAIDVVLILVLILGIIIGFQRGLLKEATDFIALFISMILAGLLKSPIANLLYDFLPFFRHGNELEGLYSLNIILYQVIIYLLLVLFFLAIYQLVMMKLKMDKKIEDTMVETPRIFNFLGAVLGGPLLILFTYNVLMFLAVPSFNFHVVNESKYANALLDNVPVVSNCNEGLRRANTYVIKEVNDSKNDKLTREYFDNQLANYMVKNKVISQKKLDKLIDKDMIRTYSEKEIQDGNDVNIKEEEND